MRGAAKWIVAGLFLILLVGGGLAWMSRGRLQTWYALRGLRKADEASRPAWIDRLVALGDQVIDPLLDALADPDDRACRNALAAIDHLARMRGIGSSNTAELIERLARRHDEFAPAIRGQVARTMATWFNGKRPAEGIAQALAGLVEASAASNETDTLSAGLDLACALIQQPGGEEALPAARNAIRAGIRSSEWSIRMRAVQLCLQPGIDLLDQVVALLQDPRVEVRRVAIVVVGPAQQVVREESLLPGLHDDDAEVRRLTEAALRGRGLRPEHLEMGRLLTHPKPTERLQVLDRINALLSRANGKAEMELDPGSWLRRLSHDGSPAVRAAALRMMSQQRVLDLSDRIEQMARNDPSPTVSQLAEYYRTRPEGRGLRPVSD